MENISALLAAEREAKKMIEEARRLKSDRIKQAKEEANAEIKAEKQVVEKQLRAIMNEYESEVNSQKLEIEQDSEEKCKLMDDVVLRNRDKVVDMLIEHVMNIQAELHINASLKK